MAAVIAIVTIAALCSKYNITEEQLSSGTHVVINGTQHCVIVESASVPGQEYKVIWNSQYKVLQCTAHNGEVCKASANGKQCYHKRVALAVIEFEKAQARQERQAEQAQAEATVEYQIEQAFRDLEDALDKLDEIAAKADEREQSRRDCPCYLEAQERRNTARLHSSNAFSLLR